MSQPAEQFIQTEQRPSVLTILQSTPEEKWALDAELQAFLNTDRSGMLKSRDCTQRLNAIISGSVLFVRDQRGKIVASSAIYKRADNHVEVGTQAVAPRARGLRLQRILTDVSVLKTPRRLRQNMFAVINENNIASRINYEKMGWRTFSPTRILRDELAKRQSSSGTLLCYSIDKTAISQSVNRAIGLIISGTPLVTEKKDQVPLHWRIGAFEHPENDNQDSLFEPRFKRVA